MPKTKKRTAREIKIDPNLLSNKNINVKIGTVQKKDNPETIYVFLSFWLRPKLEYVSKESTYLKYVLNKELQNIYGKTLKRHLENNEFFPVENDNIYIKNIPDNLNYNSKRNFISLELYLHTCNLTSKKKIPLCAKKDTVLFDEALRISNIIADAEILSNNSIFEIFKTS